MRAHAAPIKAESDCKVFVDEEFYLLLHNLLPHLCWHDSYFEDRCMLVLRVKARQGAMKYAVDL